MVEFGGAAHRNIGSTRDIKLNISVRCTLKTRKTYHCYKYFGALHLLLGNQVECKISTLYTVFLCNKMQMRKRTL